MRNKPRFPYAVDAVYDDMFVIRGKAREIDRALTPLSWLSIYSPEEVTLYLRPENESMLLLLLR